MNKEILKLLLIVTWGFIVNAYFRTICWFTGGHLWSADMNKTKFYRLHSGWYSIGGFPECEARDCIKCGKHEER
jgi:hypothetical protein